MSYQTLELVEEGDVVTVVLNRPEKRNAMSNLMKKELRVVAEELDARSNLACVLLTGKGTVFCAGNDISEVGSIKKMPLEKARRLVRLGAEMCDAWERLRALTIAVVNGPAIGGGTSLAVACDFRIMGSSAYFYAPEVELGLTYSWNSLPRIGDLIGPARAKLIGALSRKINSKLAFEWGLCEEVDNDPMGVALNLASEIQAKPRVAQQMVKESVNRYFQSPNTAFLEQDQILLALLGEEAQELHDLQRTRITS